MDIGEYLIKLHLITPDERERALLLQAQSGGELGNTIRANTLIPEDDYYRALAQYHHLGFVDLLQEKIDDAFLKDGDKENYLSQTMLPIAMKTGHYIVATANPSPAACHTIRNLYGNQTQIVVASKKAILQKLQDRFSEAYLEYAVHALLKASPALCTNSITPLWVKLTGCLFVLTMIFLFTTYQDQALIVLNMITFLGISCIVIAKF